MRIAWLTIIIGMALALGDALSLSIFKGYATKTLPKIFLTPWILIIAFSISLLQSYIFYSAMYSESLTIMNIVWDLSSDIIVTFIGIILFTEKLTPIKWIGVALSAFSILLLNIQ